jgi:ribosomal protein L32|uniref:ribosomal protein L32 n=1 Tax=Tetraselmis suecica TaxID=270643 RepID=UPI0021D5247A|nr:ribosomal protein L32 [Tetraselmis suecica]YP_010506681.1 ribosomal protein L32 [Tetraselmis suecica]UXF58539.1 ribosomal protein L32 [Tetraselmis suecica]UXF58544.1 ribosomal protein L32 [Tetraselmis suecica]
MAVPKKRTSKTKKNIRKSVWKQKINKKALKALSLAKSTFNKPLNENSEIKGFNTSQSKPTTDSESP